ncbi:hypothetical protein KBZ12_11090 [Cyanobium sp. Cruz CV13-4-11]|uniref:hypothetical protein n=1 Tax=unclassified Cyanobium TaxID=2627006 RepID=UPI0020CCE3B0|nr:MULTISPECIES: hypothetical protein [unclassified Cyanobium]MCP9920013.1 hypothetical protein [Cyanobium sp. Cruz CV13-4-11]
MLQLQGGLALVLLLLSGVSDLIEVDQLEQLPDDQPRPKTPERLREAGWSIAWESIG